MNSRSSGTAKLDLLIEAFMEQQRRGEHPSIEEYVRQHPDLASQIREVFPALAVMEELAGPTTGPYRAPVQDWTAVPQQLGEYRIVREIGRGGMGVVYEATQDSLGRRVALKVLPPQLANNAVYLERFRREAKAAAKLHHTSIVPVYGVGEHTGVHYYAMQYLRGQTIESVMGELRRFRHREASPATLQTGKSWASAAATQTGDFNLHFPGGRSDASSISNPSGGSSLAVRAGDGNLAQASSEFGQAQYFRNVAEVGVQVAEALAYAHAQGVTHRDIKPSNLMLDLNGTVWVTDFGLAKVEGSGDLTSPGDILGTLRYMAPEQLAGKSDGRSDIYSLGVTLYELATLRPAFEDPVRARLVDHIRYEEPPAPRRVEPQVPRDLERIIQKAITKEPGRRYASAGELAADLRRFLLDRPVLARSAGPVERAWRWAGRRRKFIVTGVCAVAITLGLLIGLMAVRDANRKDAVRKQTEAFMTALETRDHSALQAALTEAGRRNYGKAMFAPVTPGEHDPPATFSITKVRVEGNTARADINLQRDRSQTAFELEFMLENGAWRIESLRAASEAMKFEVHPPSFAGPPDSTLLAWDPPDLIEEPPLEAFRMEQFDALWKIDLSATNEPAGPLIERLAKDLQIAYERTEGQAHLLARHVSLSRQGCSRLEAIETICALIDLHPVYQGKSLVLKSGPRRLPAAFVGPFLIEVGDVAQFPPYATGYVPLTVRAYGLPASIVSRIERRVEIDPVQNAQGDALDDIHASYDSGGYLIFPDVVNFRQVVPLKKLLRSVQSVSIGGHLSLGLPTTVSKLRFEPIVPNTTKRAGNVSVTLRSIGAEEPSHLNLSLSGVSFSDARIIGFDGAGKAIPTSRENNFGSAEHSEISKTFKKLPASIEAVVVSETKRIRYPFALAAVSLPRHAEMPETLTPATFPGLAVPVSLTFGGVVERGIFSKVRYKFTNHSDKAIRRIDLDVTYLDANGQPADDFPGPRLSSVSSRDFGGVLKPGEVADVTVPAFHMPDTTSRAIAKVRRIEFADATTWQP